MGKGVPLGLASPPQAALCLANPAPGYFQNNWLAGLQKCLGLVFGGDQNLQAVSTGQAWRGAAAAGGSAAWLGWQVLCQGRARLDGAPCTTVKEPSRGCKPLPPGRGNHEAACAQASGRGAKPQAGNGTAAGRMEAVDSKLFSVCPCESQICHPPFSEALPGRQPGPCSSLLGAAQGGRAGHA